MTFIYRLWLFVIEPITLTEDCDLVFTTNGETPISGWSKAKRRLDEEIAAARRTRARARGDDADKVMPMPEWRIHDLRRSVATGLSNLGVAPVVADRILNHVPMKQKGQVMFVYNRAGYLKERREAMELRGGHIERVIRNAHSSESRIPESARAAMLNPATTPNAADDNSPHFESSAAIRVFIWRCLQLSVRTHTEHTFSCRHRSDSGGDALQGYSSNSGDTSGQARGRRPQLRR
jgi:hypothetical protein